MEYASEVVVVVIVVVVAVAVAVAVGKATCKFDVHESCFMLSVDS
jgi:hypothetical protein